MKSTTHPCAGPFCDARHNLVKSSRRVDFSGSEKKRFYYRELRRCPEFRRHQHGHHAWLQSDLHGRGAGPVAVDLDRHRLGRIDPQLLGHAVFDASQLREPTASGAQGKAEQIGACGAVTQYDVEVAGIGPRAIEAANRPKRRDRSSAFRNLISVSPEIPGMLVPYRAPPTFS